MLLLVYGGDSLWPEDIVNTVTDLQKQRIDIICTKFSDIDIQKNSIGKATINHLKAPHAFLAYFHFSQYHHSSGKTLRLIVSTFWLFLD